MICQSGFFFFFFFSPFFFFFFSFPHVVWRLLCLLLLCYLEQRHCPGSPPGWWRRKHARCPSLEGQAFRDLRPGPARSTQAAGWMAPGAVVTAKSKALPMPSTGQEWKFPTWEWAAAANGRQCLGFETPMSEWVRTLPLHLALQID